MSALFLALGTWVFPGSSALGQIVHPDGGVPATPLAVTGIPFAQADGWSGGPVRWDPYVTLDRKFGGMGDNALHAWINEQRVVFDYNRRGAMTDGIMGYGGHGPTPGFYGFGLSLHRGYGYGGSGLGVGADGGYPYYGGPGYPCGGFGFPGPMYPSDGPFGPFTGPAPYPEAYFAPYTAAAATTGSSSGSPPYDPFRSIQEPNPASRIIPPTSPAPGTSPDVNTVPDAGRVPPSASNDPAMGVIANSSASYRQFGIDEEPATDPDGVQGIRIAGVLPGSVAERTGLHAGDMIHAINGYQTTRRGNLAWIISHAAPDGVLKLKVRSASEGQEFLFTAQLPSRTLNLARPSYLPPVGNGPPMASR